MTEMLATTATLATGIVTLVGDERISIPLNLDTLDKFRAWTRADAFPEQGRIDYIDGNIEVDMQAEEIHDHGGVKIAIVGAIFMINEDEDRGELSSDHTRIASPVAGLSCEPDIVFVAHESIDTGAVKFITKAGKVDRYIEIEGGPDLVVEIISDSSVTKDTRRLPPGYFNAGVKEFWLVDARGEAIQFQIHARGPSEFEPVATDADGFQHSAVLNRSFQLERNRNRHGHWKYSLEHK